MLNFASVMRRIVFLILFMLMCIVAGAQKKEKQKEPTPLKTLLREAKTAIKNGRDQAKSVKVLQEAVARAGLTCEEKAEIRFMQSSLNVSMNDGENMKAYLKQNYDTASFFNTLLDASRYALMCDSMDTAPNAKGKVKARYRTKNRDLLMRHRANIYAGGRFYLRKNDYAKAIPFFTMYIDMLNEPLLAGNTSLLADTLLNRSSFYATVAAYNNNQPDVALRYIEKAIEAADKSQKPNLQEYKVRCLAAVGDSVNWLDALYDGCESYPLHDYFFTQLMEYFDQTGKYDYGLELADTMLSRVQDIPLYWYCKSVMYLRQNDNDRCIAMCDSVLNRDSLHVNAWRNKGVCMLNKAIEFGEVACYDMHNPRCREDRKKLQRYYQDARLPFERLRQLLPERKDIWASALYRIYLHLNMGKEFDEIEKLLKG